MATRCLIGNQVKFRKVKAQAGALITVFADGYPGALTLAAEASSERADNRVEKMHLDEEALPREIWESVARLFA